MTLISVRDLAIGYGQTPVASGITFDVEEGDFLCIVGENGSGKTTLMKTMLGLMEPLSGGITFPGGMKGNEIGYLGQQTQIQKDFPASVYEIVISGRLNKCAGRPFYGKEDKDAAARSMELTGITDLRNRCYRNLSGGQQQRVLLSRALCASSRLLLLDEPVSGLDPDATAEMYRIVKELNDSGVAVVMITHDVDASLKIARTVLCMGDVVRRMTVAEYLQQTGGQGK